MLQQIRAGFIGEPVGKIFFGGMMDLVSWPRSLKSIDEGNTIIYAHDDSASMRRFM